MHFAFCIIIFADVAERQTRWFQVPVKRFVWVQIPSSAPNKMAESLWLCRFAFVVRMTRVQTPPREEKYMFLQEASKSSEKQQSYPLH